MSETENGTEPPADNAAETLSTLALNTKVEDAFISPLTAIRGNLEVLRDFPDLMPYDRKRFIEAALAECARLKAGVDELAETVYSAGRRAQGRGKGWAAGEAEGAPASDSFARRIHVDRDAGIVDVDFSDFEFSDSDLVNAFYDAIDRVVLPTGRKWYFMANHRNCRVWPEAWIAFAHRGKRVNVSFSRGTVRSIDGPDAASAADPDMATSREAALERIAAMKADTRSGAA